VDEDADADAGRWMIWFSQCSLRRRAVVGREGFPAGCMLGRGVRSRFSCRGGGERVKEFNPV